MGGLGMTNPRRCLTLAALSAAVLAGCASPPPAPAEAVCDTLRPALPTWSSQDTEQSKREGTRFLDVWSAVCGDPDHR